MLNNIEAERVRHQMSKDDMAKAFGVSSRTYYNWINEKTDIPSSSLVKMAKMFDVNIDYLIEGSSGVLGESG